MKTLIALLSALALVMTLGVATVSADHPQDPDHCPGIGPHQPLNDQQIEGADGGFTEDGVLIEWSGDPGTLTLTNTSETDTATVTFCVKGGEGFAGDSQTTGEITVELAPGESTSIDYGTEISYFLLIGIVLTPPQPVEITAEAPTVTPPDCEAAGTLVIPADTDQVTYTVEPAYTAGDTGTFVVTATAATGFVFAGGETTTSWTLTVAAQLTGEICDDEELTIVAPGLDVTPATCEAAGTILFGEEDGFTWTGVDGYTVGASGTFVIVATADEGFAFNAEGATTAEFTVVVPAMLTGAVCEEAFVDLDCADFPLADGTTAQDMLDADPSDPHGLDADNDGIACEADEKPPVIIVTPPNVVVTPPTVVVEVPTGTGGTTPPPADTGSLPDTSMAGVANAAPFALLALLGLGTMAASTVTARRRR